MSSSRNSTVYLPLILALVLATGILTGYYLFNSGLVKKYSPLLTGAKSGNNITELIRFIHDNYVDSTDSKKLYQEAINGMLLSLDPHSVFIPVSEFKEANDPLTGNFEGIGVSFRIERDTVMVLNTIAGGPSAKIGLLAGDRIVKVDGKNISSIKINNEQVMKLLKGPKGTKVKVGIFRRGLNQIRDYTITRDVIPTWSIDVAYAVSSHIAYVKLSKFSATTGDELRKTMKDMKEQGIDKLILDLRDNTGGYLPEAISVADEFLSEGKTIVFTKGLHRKKQVAEATSEGEWDKLPVAVLIDEGSASASEIVAGAIQDNDRGTIIGRRSFGKGLVQEQIELSDGSALRLTIARYYTPTGRCIQKPYDKGSEDYYMEYYRRLENGELEYADSIKVNDSLKYTTPGGKTVYGGGGITPDIFIPIENDITLSFYNQSVNKGILYQFSLDYTDTHRRELAVYKTPEMFDHQFNVGNELYEQFIAFASANGIKSQQAETQKSKLKVTGLMKSYIARNLFDDKGFYPIFLRTDKAFQKALEVLK